MITNKKVFIKEILIALGKLIIAGVLIGLLKKFDIIIALLLVLKIFYNVSTEIVKPKNKNNGILLIGMLLTGFSGIIG